MDSAIVSAMAAVLGSLVGGSATIATASITRTLDKPDTLLPLYALINRVRLSAFQPVLAEPNTC